MQPSGKALPAKVDEKPASLDPEAQDPVSLRQQVNRILLSLVAKAFPATRKPDVRVSTQPEFKANSGYTWMLYNQVRRPAQRLIQQWRYLVLFGRASKNFRKQPTAQASLRPSAGTGG